MEPTTASEPKPIETEIEQALNRVRQTYESSDRLREPRPLGEERAALATGKLLERKFPKRHVQDIPKMYGRGLEVAREFTGRVVKGDCILILVGDRGPGKTQIATYWAHQRYLDGRGAGRYVKCIDLIAEIRATWNNRERGISEDDVLRKYRSTPYLVIDEMHERGSSEWEAQQLVNLIDHRYDDRRVTVLIANLSVEKISEAINPSILSRAQETGGIIVCDWPSYRESSRESSDET